MRKYDVDIQTIASATITVEISDEKLQEIADKLGVTVDDISVYDLEEYLWELAETPTICAQCSGWGQNYGMDLNDEWQLSDDTDSKGEHPENPQYRSIRIKK